MYVIINSLKFETVLLVLLSDKHVASIREAFKLWSATSSVVIIIGMRVIH